MKMVDSYKVSKEMVNDQDAMYENYNGHFQKMKRRLLEKKSMRILNPTVQLYDQDGDNIVRNLVTCITKFDAYKVPRIIKRLISK